MPGEVQPRLGSLCRLPTALARCDPARPARIAVVGPASAGNASLSELPPEYAAAFAAQRAAGGSWTSVNLQGTLQERGSLAVDRWSERRYFSKGDCLHPAPPGLARLMAALKSRHFEPLRRRELRS